MIENPYYTNEFHGDYELIGIGQLDLEEGGSIPDCQLAVATFGVLNEAKDNAILIPTWYSGTHQIWRDVYIGPDHALNPEKYFIVCIDQIGSGCRSPHIMPPAPTPVLRCRSSRTSASATTWSRRSDCCVSTSASNASPW